MKYPFLLIILLYAFGACTPSAPKEPENPQQEPVVNQPTPQVHPTSPSEMTSPSELASPPLEASSLEGMEWMVGTWKQQENEQTASYETWNKESNERFTGSACTIQSGDTVWKEALEIRIEGNKAIYFATVPENDGPVGFTMTRQDAQRVDFENPEHDFPWKITYHRGNDTLYARIAGFRNGQAAFNDLVMLKEN